MKTEDNNGPHIVYLGENGFPFGLAPIQRQLLIAGGLRKAGANILVINNKGVHEQGKEPPPKGIFQGISYIYTSGRSYRSKRYITRNLLKIKGVFGETRLLWQRSRKGKIDCAIVATMRFQQILYYYLISRIFRFKILLNYVEQNDAITTRNSLRNRINDKLIDKWSFHCADAILPISHYLERMVKERCPDKPFLRIPILADFDVGMERQHHSHESYILYCGSATYLALISFIIRSFEAVKRDDLYLHLVVNGDDVEMSAFKNAVKKSVKSEFIRVFSGLPFKQLLVKYREAQALLIPLRPTIQDKARFPHKIGEYLASGTPMVTTNFGEIREYFIDEETAFIAEKYEPKMYAGKIIKLLQHPVLAAEVGQKGFIFGKQEFHYVEQGIKILNFIKTITD